MKNQSFNTFSATLMLAAAVIAPGAANAYQSNGSFFDHAQVTRAEPIYETVVKSVPVEQCWKERVPVRHSDYSHRSRHRHYDQSATPTIVGAILGGALGNELGSKKRNKQIGVAVGSLLGASLGRDIGREKQRERYATREYGQGHHNDVSYELVDRCSVEYEQYKEQALVGYDVSYRYKGNTYQTVTQRDPGDRLKIRVNVVPVD